MDLLCYGPVEKGLDASQPGGVEFVNWCVDGAALATLADSFAALKLRVETEKRITWQELDRYIKADWAGPDGERTRLMMKNIPRYGSGGTIADDYAVRASDLFTKIDRWQVGDAVFHSHCTQPFKKRLPQIWLGVSMPHQNVFTQRFRVHGFPGLFESPIFLKILLYQAVLKKAW